MHAHPLRGAVEPELFAPEDLLEGGPPAGGLLSLTEAGEPTPLANGGAPGGAQHQQQGGPHKWFSQWFGAGGGGGGGPPDGDGGDASPLRQPPFVRAPTPMLVACLLQGCATGFGVRQLWQCHAVLLFSSLSSVCICCSMPLSPDPSGAYLLSSSSPCDVNTRMLICLASWLVY